MDSLIIHPTEDSPSVIFDLKSKRFIISGESRPENASKFFTPVIDWVVEFEKLLFLQKNELADTTPFIFSFKLEYFNSATAKYFMDMLLILKKIVTKGYNIAIEWNYEKRDICMLDSGKDFSEIVDLKFDFIEY